jgi:hypothetical protein
MKNEPSPPLRSHAPQPSSEGVRKYAELIRSHTGQRLTPEDAEAEAVAFLALCHTIIQADIETTHEVSEKLGAGEEVR